MSQELLAEPTVVSASTTVRVACAQLAARDVEDHERALGEALEAVTEAGNAGADLVVLPECTYPAYILAVESPPRGLRPDAEVVSTFGDAARTHRLSVAVGLARGWRPSERVGQNHAILFGPDGSVRLEADKRFLWDFDRCWFEAGGPSRPGTMTLRPAGEVAAVGMLICADLRMPEVARSLVVDGARLLLDPTAWVTGGDPTVLSNPQPEYLMSVRALENGVWIAAADKVGMERGTVVYAGRSAIVAPDGSVAAMASPSEPEVVWADVDLSQAKGPPVPRRPDLYHDLVDGEADAQAETRRSEPLTPDESILRVGLLQPGDDDRTPAVHAAITGRLPLIGALGISLLAVAARGAEEDVSVLNQWAADRTGIATAVAAVDRAGEIRRLGVVHSCGRLDAHPTHQLTGRSSASLQSRTLDIGTLRVGAMVGWEGLAPEVARILALAGADLVVWAAGAGTQLVLPIARARAMENRVWVALLQPRTTGASLGQVNDGASARVALVDPEGRPVALGMAGREHLVTSVVNMFASRAKQVTPGTDALADRQPESYASLVENASGRRR